jgi:palmitoyl-protein thioesterase
VRKYVIYGSQHDGIVDPWQTQFFGFYDQNMKIIDMIDQDFYKRDTFGLQSLNRSGRLIIENIPNVEHLDWVIRTDIIPRYLTHLN